jgi:hypothetical protein
MSGSLLKTPRERTWPETLVSYISINRYALYNLGDEAFGQWYLERIPRYTASNEIPSYPWGRWEMDIFHYLSNLAESFDFQQVSAKFRLTDLIVNYWNSSRSDFGLREITEKEKDAVIVSLGKDNEMN